MTINAKRPNHLIKHEIKGEDGKTVRSLRVGALWAPEGNHPSHIHLEAIPTNLQGLPRFRPMPEKDGLRSNRAGRAVLAALPASP